MRTRKSEVRKVRVRKSYTSYVCVKQFSKKYSFFYSIGKGRMRQSQQEARKCWQREHRLLQTQALGLITMAKGED